MNSLLNSKQKFGANNLTEIGVKRGNFLAGDQRKRKEKGGEEEEEEAVETMLPIVRKQPRKIMG